MAEVTITKAVVTSFGSCKLAIVQLTTANASDTYTIEKYAPVVDYWYQSHVGTAGYSGDVKYVASTGVFTITTAQQGAGTLFILMKT